MNSQFASQNSASESRPTPPQAPSVAPSDVSRPSTYRGRVNLPKPDAPPVLSEPDDQPPNTVDTLTDIQRIVAANEHLEETDDGPKKLVLTPVYQHSPPSALRRYFPSHSFLDLPFKSSSYHWDWWMKKPATWPAHLPEWHSWVNRMLHYYEGAFVSQGIYPFIMLSLEEFNYDSTVLPALMSYWNRCFNFFHLPCGSMSVTLMDVAAITGLPVDGFEASSVMGTTREEDSIDYSIPPKYISPPPLASSKSLLSYGALYASRPTVPVPPATSWNRCCHQRLTSFKRKDLEDAHEEMFNARENAAFKMPPFLPNCSPSFKSWWAGQWKSITDKENVEVIATRLAPPGGKRITKPKKKRVAPNQYSDEENGAPLKKKPTLNASATLASSNLTDDHLIAEAKKPKATKPSLTVSLSPLPVLKPASFLPQAAPSSTLGLSSSSNPFKISSSTPFGYTSGPSVSTSIDLKVSPSKEDTGSKLATPMTPSAWMAKTPSATPPSDPSPPEEASSASKTKEPSAKKTLDFDTPLDLTLASPTGLPAKETLNSPKPVTPKPTPTKTLSTPSLVDPTSSLLLRHESLKRLISKAVPSPYRSVRDSEVPSEAALDDALKTLYAFLSDTSLALKEKNLEPIYAAAHVWSFSPGISEDTAQFWHYFPQSFQDAVSKLNRLSTALDQTKKQRSEFERCQKDIENENSKVFEVAIPTDEEFQVDSKISEVERKITDLQVELASLKAHRADLATKREQNIRDRMDRLEIRSKELIARRPEIDEIDRRRAYLQFQIDHLSVDVESWNDYLPPRKEADNSDDTDGDDGEGEENS
ncbi:hypothetical protein COLO4_28241 [Corchorus olitorius]|uniref:Aminotransferase-like plant mobile domain-containing protein n=1 Tax=Corchorus olitorius TaxID=93759 RepID=A0A1R3HM85_9ROSI|nr:hypothetical protein COLO4_28241 [Corchorus olitorius]